MLAIDLLEQTAADESVDLEPSTSTAAPSPSEQQYAGKYRPLGEWLLHQEQRPITVTFSDIEQVLGFALPDSCRAHVAYWYSYDGSAVARASSTPGGAPARDSSTRAR
jgi:hypothetical protein